MFEELERELAADGWSESAFFGVMAAARRDVRSWRAAFHWLREQGVRPADAEDGQTSEVTISEPLLRAWVRYAVAKMAIDVMGDAMKAAEARGESPNRPACGAYFAVWRVFPILNARIMSAEWASRQQRDRAIVGLSSWLSMRVREGASEELAAALRDSDLGFLPALCERLPGAIVEAWYELPEDRRSAQDLLNRATNLLRREARLKAMRRPDGAYERVHPLRLSGIEREGAHDEAESFILLEEAKQAAVGLLTARQAEIFRLYLEGYHEAEIAEMKGIETGTVGSTVSRAWAKIEGAGTS